MDIDVLRVALNLAFDAGKEYMERKGTPAMQHEPNMRDFTHDQKKANKPWRSTCSKR